jgi:hypothetical protein
MRDVCGRLPLHLAAQGGHLAAAAALAAALTAAKVSLWRLLLFKCTRFARVHACCWSVYLFCAP